MGVPISGISTADAKSVDEAGSDEESTLDVSRENLELSTFKSRSSENEIYIYRNSFHLISELRGLKNLKFFCKEIDIVPPEVGDLAGVEILRVKFSVPVLSGVSLEKLETLKELELCRVPPRSSAFSSLGKNGILNNLTKLSVCHFSIRFLPPEIGYLKQLVELDLSFNKLKNLPNDIGELSALRSLRVANNKLVDLPSVISSLRRLEKLDLSHNKLISLTPLRLASMQTLRYINFQYNNIHLPCQIPLWMFCEFGGNEEDMSKNEMNISVAEVTLPDLSVQKVHENRTLSGCRNSSSSYSEALSKCRCSPTHRMKKGWRCRDCLQQRAREERLNYSRKWRVDYCNDNMVVNMGEENESCESTILEEVHTEVQFDVDEEKAVECTVIDDLSDSVDANGSVIGKEILLISADCGASERNGLSISSYGEESSCLTESTSSNKGCDDESESICNSPSPRLHSGRDLLEDNSSPNTVKFIVKSKRHCDRDLDNPKPSKFRKPVDEGSTLSCKYSAESFCSIDDHLPDGFYDAGRDRPFMTLEEYEQSPGHDSREVILLDRDRDEELDAIASSAQILLSSFKRSLSGQDKDCEADNLQRATVLALFVSDCFGGSDRSAAVIKLRKAVVGSHKQQPFVCTCMTKNVCYSNEISKPIGGVENFNFNQLCENSLRLIKAAHNSNVVPIGKLRFGVCRHRAVLMKYLCDRADPPIPCELVRGYLDFMPHAWNAILVKRSNSWVRMVVDACYPTDIREENDIEFSCRYIPLCRAHVPLTTENSYIGHSLSSPFLCLGTGKTQSRSVFHCKVGTMDAAVKMRNLESCKATPEEIKSFEYTFLGEVRMLSALRKHSCIVEIYGHQLSSKWAPSVDGIQENRLLQSLIIMEYVKGGSLKMYLDKLLERGEKHVPLDIALYIARDVACALVELHSKCIIHRDIKSENILIDLDRKRNDGTPVVKLADFDRSVPLRSFVHTCCNAHLGIHPPDACVGTPRWMAPEVVQAMYQRSPYGMEVDIWSYGCLLFELLTLQIPYFGSSEPEIYNLLQMKRRPKLTPELEVLALYAGPKAGLESKVFSDATADTMYLLVELFYQCTSSDPADRPTAQCIYDKLVDAVYQLDVSQTGSGSISSS